ncbi:MAG: GNAT family N-acetyltransferase [Cyanobacteria bacterium P01_A01_bin.84]
MDLQIIDLQNPLWGETLKKLRHDVYHLPEYVKLEAERNNTTAEAFVFIEDEIGDEKIIFVPYLLRSCNDILNGEGATEELFDVVSPYGYPGILLSEAARNSPEFIETALSKLKYLFREKNICSAFFRLHPILSNNFTDIFPEDTFTDNGKTVSIDLTLSEEKIWAKTRKGHQSTINKCKRLGFTGKIVPFGEYIHEFIEIYTETMNRVQAKESYYFDETYFHQLLNLGDRLHLGIVEMNDEIACTSLFFESCGIVQAHLGGTTNKYISQSPFNYLLHYVRLWAKERGNEFLHIGGGIGGSSEDSLYTFKSGFSKQRHTFLTLRLITNEEKYQHLINLRMNHLNLPSTKFTESSFFPAYRLSI